jgi:hypothetical protein
MKGVFVYFFKGIIDIVIVVLLLRLLIRPREAFFDPIYGLVYRITNPLLIPAGYITGNASYGTLLTILALVVLRGGVYVSLQPISFLSAIGISFWSLAQLLFQAYTAMWVVSLLSERSFGGSFFLLIDRALGLLQGALKSLGIPEGRFRLFIFLFLLILYALLSTLIRYVIIPKAGLSPALYALLSTLIRYVFIPNAGLSPASYRRYYWRPSFLGQP